VNEREAIQLEPQEEAQCCHGTSKPIISWIASLPLAMMVYESPASSLALFFQNQSYDRRLNIDPVMRRRP